MLGWIDQLKSFGCAALAGVAADRFFVRDGEPGRNSVARRIMGTIPDLAVGMVLFFITPYSTTLPAILASALAAFLIISDLFPTFRYFLLDRSSVVGYA